MSTDFTYAWKNAERGCWEYWNNVLGSVEGLTAFSLRNLPKTLPNAESFIWRFSLNGGGIAVPRQSRDRLTGGAWQMDGLMECWTTSDDTAMWLGGIIMHSQPIVSTDVPGLQRCYASEYPSREPDMIKLGGDDNAGHRPVAQTKAAT